MSFIRPGSSRLGSGFVGRIDYIREGRCAPQNAAKGLARVCSEHPS